MKQYIYIQMKQDAQKMLHLFLEHTQFNQPLTPIRHT